MPRRKQSNPQPVKCESEDGAVVCDPSCLVLESDFLLSGELEFGDSDIMGLDRDSGMTVFSLSVEDDPSAPTDSTFPAFLSCRGCGQLLGDTPLGAGLDLGVGLDLGAELYCLPCEEGLQHDASIDSSQAEGLMEADGPAADVVASKQEAGDVPSKLYSCSLCAFTSRYSNHLKRHMRTHDGQKPYRCPACPYASAQLVNLQRHARTHTGEKPYGCHQCSYACSSLGNLRRHQRMHTQERPQRREKEKRRGRRKKASANTDEDLTLRVSQDSGYLQTLGGLGSPSAPLPVLLFPLCCQMCGLTLEEADLEGDKAEGEGDGDGGQVRVSPLLAGSALQRRTWVPVQPGGTPPRVPAESPRQLQAVPLPPLPLPVPLPQPPGTPRPHPLRGETPPLPPLPLHLLAPRQPQAPHARAHRRETLPVPVLQLRLRQPRQPAAPRAHPLRRQALPLRRVRLLVQPEHEPEEAHAAAHGREAVRLRRVRLHHRPLGQLQASPEEARPQHGQLGQARARQRPRLGKGAAGGPEPGVG